MPFRRALKHATRHTERKQQRAFTANKSSPLLNLPAELVLSIADWLPLTSKVILTQTCRALHELLEAKCLPEVQRAKGEDRMEVLSSIAEYLADSQYCRSCNQLHAVNKHDKPYGHLGTTAHRQRWWGHSLAAPVGEALVHSGLPVLQHRYTLRHNHVQLALKLARMESNKRYLAELLKPRSRAATFHGSQTRVTHSHFPRIVNGRFLLRSRWSFTCWRVPQRPPPVRIAILQFGICAHLTTGSFVQRTPHAVPVFDYNLRGIIMSSLLTHEALAQPGDGPLILRGSCTKCCTDFSILWHGRFVTFLIYQDLGPSSPPNNPHWKAFIEPTGDGCRCARDSILTAFGSDGGIDAVFEYEKRARCRTGSDVFRL